MVDTKSAMYRHLSQLNHHRGFTLIEMMIVVSIIAILAAIAYPSYLGYQERTNRADMMAEIQQMVSRIEAQKINYKKYENIPLSTIFIKTPTSGKMEYPTDRPSLYEVTILNISNGDNDKAPKITGANLSTVTWKIQAKPKTNGRMKGDGALSIDYTGKKCRGNTCGYTDEWRN